MLVSSFPFAPSLLLPFPFPLRAPVCSPSIDLLTALDSSGSTADDTGSKGAISGEKDKGVLGLAH